MTAGADEVLAAEDQFFSALLHADGEALRALLTQDFVLIDVLTGSEIPAPALVDVVGAGQLRFEAIERLEGRVRRYGSAAVVTGRTRMRGHYGDEPFGAHSRYTHVYVRRTGGWKLASAQGTPVAEAVTASGS
jgi:ketosteroid isomerase-like protein